MLKVQFGKYIWFEAIFVAEEDMRLYLLVACIWVENYWFLEEVENLMNLGGILVRAQDL